MIISSVIFPKFWTFRENVQRLDPRKLTNVPLKKGPFHKERFHSLKLIYLLKRQFWRWFSELPKVGYYVSSLEGLSSRDFFRGHSLVFGEVTVTQKWNLFCQGGFCLSLFHVFGDLGFSCSIQKHSFRWESKWKSLYHFSITKSKWPSNWTTWKRGMSWIFPQVKKNLIAYTAWEGIKWY